MCSACCAGKWGEWRHLFLPSISLSFAISFWVNSSVDCVTLNNFIIIIIVTGEKSLLTRARERPVTSFYGKKRNRVKKNIDRTEQIPVAVGSVHVWIHNKIICRWVGLGLGLSLLTLSLHKFFINSYRRCTDDAAITGILCSHFGSGHTTTMYRFLRLHVKIVYLFYR